MLESTGKLKRPCGVATASSARPSGRSNGGNSLVKRFLPETCQMEWLKYTQTRALTHAIEVSLSLSAAFKTICV